MGTRGQWATDFAKALGNNNPSASLVNWISAWTAKEGTKAKYNPLATTYKLPPYTDFNSVGVKNYETRAQGIDASIRTLRGNHAGYADIVKGIVTDNPELAADGLIRSPWGTNGSAVRLLWQNTDVRDQMLKSEPENVSGSERVSPSANTPINPLPPRETPDDIMPVNPLGPEVQTDKNKPYTLAGETPKTARRAAYVFGGLFLLIIAGGVAFKTYVPSKQVVETIASVAAVAA